jgi:hypothetical protein
MDRNRKPSGAEELNNGVEPISKDEDTEGEEQKKLPEEETERQNVPKEAVGVGAAEVKPRRGPVPRGMQQPQFEKIVPKPSSMDGSLDAPPGVKV